ncbi:LORF2 protein, partial [Crocuta crocuta]
TLIRYWWRRRMVQPLWRALWQISYKAKHLSYDPAILPLGYLPKRISCPHPSSAIPGQNGSTFSKRKTASRCLSAGESIKTVWFIDIMEYYSAIRKKEALPYGTAWMDLEGMMLSGVSQTEKD